MCLEDLAEKSDDPNVKFFSKLFATDIRATDAEIDDILSRGGVAEMVATAIDSYTARDPHILVRMQELVYMVQKVIGYAPAVPKLVPHLS